MTIGSMMSESNINLVIQVEAGKFTDALVNAFMSWLDGQGEQFFYEYMADTQTGDDIVIHPYFEYDRAKKIIKLRGQID